MTCCRCMAGVSPHVINCLVERLPCTVRLPDKKGRIPLHSACYGRSSLDVIEYLVEVWPEAVLQRDKKGESPLDLAKMPVH